MTQRDGARTLRVATWNVLHGMDLRRGLVDAAAVAAAVDRLDADVVALQEVDRWLPRSAAVDQATEIATRVGLHVVFAPALVGDPDSSWRAVSGADPGGGGYGIALLSRSPLTDVAWLRLPGGGDGARRAPTQPGTNPGWDREPRVAVRASVAVHGRSVLVTTAHLSYLPWRGLRQLRRVTRWLAGLSPAVLMGDFNLPPWAVAMAARGWRPTGGGRTFPAPAPRIQLDHVLVRGVEVQDVRVSPPLTSDHHAVVADLLIP